MENGIMVPFVWKKAGATLSKEAVKDEFNRIMFKKYPSYKDFMEDFDKKVNDYFSGWKFKSVEKMIEFRDLKYEEFEKALIRYSKGQRVDLEKVLNKLRKEAEKYVEEDQQFFDECENDINNNILKLIGKKNILKRLGKEIKINFDKKEGNFEILEIEDEDDINKEFGNECKEDFNNNKYNFEKFLEKSISCNASIQNQLRGTSHDIISQVTEISLISDQGKSDILQNIANLYEKACDAKDVLIKVNQTEILCWSNFIIAFDKNIDEIMARDRIGMKKAKGLIYDFILAQNPDTKHSTLYKKIERARKIYRLTERIGLDKIKHIKSYSVNSISKFTNEEIQRIIDHFTKNSNMKFTDNSKDVKQDNEVLEEPDQINVLEVLSPKESIAPIPLVHVFNTSNNSKEEA
ncbi:hypothetical protein RirG_109320 [Rhizophagus irregularis DAOM 197198w]|uniref:Uncharacterized protein n=1 Tax=Rhizophagus irregularis (strain DAOM 197198w) TaxID=1432141 RepID=A0A015JER3_RHIIW|nr:hypothetical protein RirG_109320 [Rhizophagus irregularis DAOM 197198w]